jgi:hypothetical protein
MKTSLLVLLCLFGSAAFAQVGGGALSAEPQIFEITGHVQHADFRPMAVPGELRMTAPMVAARGERPLWEVAPHKQEIPLGDVARYLRKQHETAKKSEILWEN